MAVHSVRSFQILSIFWLVAVQLSVEPVFAEDDLSIVHYIPNIISLDYGIDSDEGRDFYLHGNLSIKPRHRLLVGMGSQEDTVSGSEEGLKNSSYLLGYSHYLSYNTQLSAEYEHWGDSSKVTRDSLRANLSFNAEHFSIVVSPEFRKIKVNNDSQCDKEIDSGSAQIRLSVDVSERYTVNVAYVSYDYSENLTKLPDCVDAGEVLLVESRIENVADDSQRSLGIDYFRGTETYGFDYTTADSAISSGNSKIYSFYASTDQYDDWSFTVTASIIKNYDKSTTRGLTGSATYYW